MAKKLTAAAASSELIVSAMDRASAALRTGNRPYNGHGVLADPSNMYGKLYDAKKAIDEAMAAYKATEWPSADDYELAEVR